MEHIINRTLIKQSKYSQRILDLMSDIGLPIDSPAGIYTIGDGHSWLQNVSHDFDQGRRRSALADLRKIMNEKVQTYISHAKNQKEIDLLLSLEIELRRSDQGLIKSVGLVGLTRNSGLFECIIDIIKSEENNQ